MHRIKLTLPGRKRSTVCKSRNSLVPTCVLFLLGTNPSEVVLKRHLLAVRCSAHRCSSTKATTTQQRSLPGKTQIVGRMHVGPCLPFAVRLSYPLQCSLTSTIFRDLTRCQDDAIITTTMAMLSRTSRNTKLQNFAGHRRQHTSKLKSGVGEGIAYGCPVVWYHDYRSPLEQLQVPENYLAFGRARPQVSSQEL
jgi:hypothetical protein